VASAGAARIDAQLEADALALAEEGAELARTAGLEAQADALTSDHNVGYALAESARDRDAAAIVAGTRGRSAVGAAVLGSVAGGLVRRGPVPVLVVPR
jgi:nucleotide-binding universal stress UspA family protein